MSEPWTEADRYHTLWKARAEDAEARVKELEAAVQHEAEWRKHHHVWHEHYKTRAEQAEARAREVKQERDSWKAAAEEQAETTEYWRQRAEDAEARIQQWESVFGHLSRDPDEAGNLIYREQQRHAERINTLEKIAARLGERVRALEAWLRDGIRLFEPTSVGRTWIEGARAILAPPKGDQA